MSVIRGKLFTDRKIVPLRMTIGDFHFKKDKDGWYCTKTGERYEAVSLDEMLKRTRVEVALNPQPPKGSREMSDDKAVERGPNYDWKHEAEHYRDECDKLRDLLRKIEVSGDKLFAENSELKKSLFELRVEKEKWHRLYGASFRVARELLAPDGYELFIQGMDDARDNPMTVKPV